MRLFVALDPPEAVVGHLRRALDPVRDRHPELTWSRPETWHITLAFLGEVDEAAVPGLAERLARVARRHTPLALVFTGCGRFGSRTLWIGVDGDREPLRRLADRAAAAARHSDIAVDARSYRPHLTVARCRSGKGDRGVGTTSDLRQPVAELEAYAGVPWVAEELLLVRSRLGPVVRHETIGSWALDGAGPDRKASGAQDRSSPPDMP